MTWIMCYLLRQTLDLKPKVKPSCFKKTNKGFYIKTRSNLICITVRVPLAVALLSKMASNYHQLSAI